MAFGSVAGTSILDLAWRRAAWAQAMAPGAATDLAVFRRHAHRCRAGLAGFQVD